MKACRHTAFSMLADHTSKVQRERWRCPMSQTPEAPGCWEPGSSIAACVRARSDSNILGRLQNPSQLAKTPRQCQALSFGRLVLRASVFLSKWSSLRSRATFQRNLRLFKALLHRTPRRRLLCLARPFGCMGGPSLRGRRGLRGGVLKVSMANVPSCSVDSKSPCDGNSGDDARRQP